MVVCMEKLKLSIDVSTKKQNLESISKANHKHCDHSGEVPSTGELNEERIPN